MRVRRREERWWHARRKSLGPRAFRGEIQHCPDQAVTCLENLMSTLDFINVAYDMSGSFRIPGRRSFYYDKIICGYFARVLGIVPVSRVLHEQIACENWEI